MMKHRLQPFSLATLAAAVLAATAFAADPETHRPATTNGPAPVTVCIEFGDKKTHKSARKFSNTGDVTVVGENFELKEGKTSREVVVVGGNATIAGKVRGDVAVVLGSLTLAPTAVIEGQQVVVVGGTLHAASNTVVRGDVTVVGGQIEAEPGFKADGEQHVIGWPDLTPEWLKDWVNKGLLRGALLPSSTLASWIFVAVALLFNILLSLLFPRPLQACTDAVREKPVQSFLLGLLLLAAFGPLCLLLVISCIGIPVVPFVVFVALMAMVFGFIAVYRCVGQRLGQFGDKSRLEQPLLALGVGTLVLNLAYMLPVAGFIVWGLVMMLGFGAAWLALFGRAKRQAPPLAPAGVPPFVVPQPVATAVPPVAASSAVPSTPPAAPPLELTSLPRPGFWMRIGAALLDCIVISLVISPCGMQHNDVLNDTWPTLLLLVYLIALWTWRGTTIGNIVFGMKIVRTDGQPLTFGVAVVRALASLLSLAVIGLGFFWIAWDREKQAWHDKIAGTLVVRMPKGVSLI